MVELQKLELTYTIKKKQTEECRREYDTCKKSSQTTQKKRKPVTDISSSANIKQTLLSLLYLHSLYVTIPSILQEKS